MIIIFIYIEQYNYKFCENPVNRLIVPHIKQKSLNLMMTDPRIIIEMLLFLLKEHKATRSHILVIYEEDRKH